MKSRHPTERRARAAGGASLSAAPERGRGPVILDFVQSQIEAFDVEHGGGVFVRKDARGYTLVRQEDAMPVARLRPRDNGQFEVLRWDSFQDRWRGVGDFGAVLSLDDALDFIADDPMDCFWR